MRTLLSNVMNSVSPAQGTLKDQPGGRLDNHKLDLVEQPEVDDFDGVEEINIDLRSIRESLQAESKEVYEEKNQSVNSNGTVG